MRKVAGWVLTVLGVLGVLVGLAVAIVLGPDGRRTTGPHPVDTESSVLVTAPKVIDWADVQIDVLVEVPAKKPIFVGVGNTVDVEAFVGDVDRVEVTDFSTPWKPTYTPRQGDLPTVQGAPTSLDWWLASSAGLGGASMTSSLPDEHVSLAVIAIGSSNLSGLEVTFAYGIKGGFWKGLGLALAGAGLALGGGILRRGDALLEEDQLGDGDDVDTDEPDFEEEVTYVYVDDDGVEHELTEADLAEGDFDVVDEGGVDEDGVDEERVEEDGVDESTVEGTVDEETSDEEASDEETSDEPTDEPPAQPAAEPVDESNDAPRYVWIDDDGVEHELTEADLAEMGDYEIVDEEDER